MTEEKKEKKELNEEELDNANGGLVGFYRCPNCMDITSLDVFVQNGGYCSKCGQKAGATAV